MPTPTPLRGLTTFLRLTWLDTISLILMLSSSSSLFILPIHRASYRLIPMTATGPSSSTTITTSSSSSSSTGNALELHGPPALSYPYFDEIVSSPLCAAIVVAVPLCVIAVMQVWVRSVWDFHAGALGTVRAVGIATFAQVLLKEAIGGFRPHFLAVCKLDMASATLFRGLVVGGVHWIPTSFCTGDERLIKYALQSFPSGHSASSFAAAIFLSLYLNAKLKTFADYAAPLWAVSVTLIPLVGASVIAGCVLLDHHHHPHDIIFGIIIGIFAGIVAYRTSFASLLDYHFNHIPLPPATAHMRFSYNIVAPSHDSDHILESNVEFADDLVVNSWWAKARQDFEVNDGQWLRSLRSLKRTSVEMNKASSALPFYYGTKGSPRRLSAASEALRADANERRMSAAGRGLSSNDKSITNNVAQG